MVCRSTGRQFHTIFWAAVIALSVALPAAAQNRLIGKVTDMKGQPIEGATVVVEQPSNARKYESKTGKGGEYVQVGLPPGSYIVTV